MLYAGITRNPLCLQHGGNRFLVGLFQLDCKGSRTRFTLVDPNAPAFLSPTSMKAAFDEAAGERLASIGDYFRCAYRSLAESYAQAIRELEDNTGRTYSHLCIVGGGAKNGFLNRLTEEASGKQVAALPIEATALGNLKIQMEADR